MGKWEVLKPPCYLGADPPHSLLYQLSANISTSLCHMHMDKWMQLSLQRPYLQSWLLFFLWRGILVKLFPHRSFPAAKTPFHKSPPGKLIIEASNREPEITNHSNHSTSPPLIRQKGKSLTLLVEGQCCSLSSAIHAHLHNGFHQFCYKSYCKIVGMLMHCFLPLRMKNPRPQLWQMNPRQIFWFA